MYYKNERWNGEMVCPEYGKQHMPVVIIRDKISKYDMTVKVKRLLYKSIEHIYKVYLV